MTNEQAIFYLKIDREQKIDAMSSPEVAKKTCTVIAYDKGIEALEKQIPKKFEVWNGNCCCPACNKLFGAYTQLKTLIHWEMPYCKFCGQAIDWSDTYDKR